MKQHHKPCLMYYHLQCDNEECICLHGTELAVRFILYRTGCGLLELSYIYIQYTHTYKIQGVHKVLHTFQNVIAK